jgi:hypothetical protein
MVYREQKNPDKYHNNCYLFKLILALQQLLEFFYETVTNILFFIMHNKGFVHRTTQCVNYGRRFSLSSIFNHLL